MSTVLEEDEELGDGESVDDGIDTLLSDVEGLLEDRSEHSKRSKTAMKAATQVESRVFSSLKEMKAPKELREATALLMSSCLLDESTAMLLTRDIMDLTANNSSATGSIDVQEEGNNTSHIDNNRLQEEMKQAAKNSSTHGNNDGQSEDYDTSHRDNNRLQEEVGQDEDDTEALMSKDSDDTVTLLKASTVNENMLKPSIWNIHGDEKS